MCVRMVRLGVVALIVLSSFQLGAFADDAPGGGPSLRGGATAGETTQSGVEGLPPQPATEAVAAGTGADPEAEGSAETALKEVAKPPAEAIDVGLDGAVPAQTEPEAGMDLTNSAAAGSAAGAKANVASGEAAAASASSLDTSAAAYEAVVAELAAAKASVRALQEKLAETQEQEEYQIKKAAENLASAARSEEARVQSEAQLAEKTTALAEKEQACTAMETELRQLLSDSQRLMAEETKRLEDSFTELQTLLTRKERKLEEALKEVEAGDTSLKAMQKRYDRNEAELVALKHQHQDLEALYADPSLQHFLQTTAHKVARHPGIEGATNKTFKYVLPKLRAGELLGRQWLNSTHSTVFQQLHNERFMALLGHDAEPWLPLLTGVLVYGLVIMPCCCTICCLTRVVCRPKLILTFCHLYFTISCLCASGFAAIMGTDPLVAFAARDSELYLFVQVAFAIVLIVYSLFILLLRCFVSHEAVRGYRTFQLLVVSAVATAYYALVWTPAMADTSPQLDDTVAELARPWISPQMASMLHWLPYLLLTFLFSILLLLEQHCWKDRSNTLSVDVTDLDQVKALIKECKNRGGEMLTELATLVDNPESRKGD